jgi:hypothetical protein
MNRLSDSSSSMSLMLGPLPNSKKGQRG